MNANKDWMEKSHEQLYEQATMTTTYLTSANLARMGISGTANTWYSSVLMPKYTAFKAAFLAWQNPAERTSVKQTLLEEAEKDFREVYRQLYKGYLKDNPLVTSDDLVAMGLPKRSDGSHKPADKPTTLVEMITDTSIPGAVGISFRDMGSGRWAKPRGVHGAEFIWAILDEPATDRSQLTHSSFDTRTPVEFPFEENDRGRKFSVCARWENTRGEKGPWGEILTVIIP
jgi:hypothetical protein